MKDTTRMSAVFLALFLIRGPHAGYAQSSDIREEILIGAGGAPSIGEKTAKVTMFEFSDYQCPLCSQYFNWTMKQVMDEYVKTGKVKYVFRDFPLESIHPLALKAAEAAHCGGEQGKYWEMHDRFLRNQMSIGIDALPLHAQVLALDVSKFRQCLDSGKYTAQIRESVADGKKAGVRGTPSFFLGLTNSNEPKVRALIYVDGAQPYAVFKEAIDKLLSFTWP